MITRARITALTAVALLCGAAVAHAQAPAAIDAALKAAHEKYKNLKEGKNADYIPALAKVDSKIYGIALSRVPHQCGRQRRCVPRQHGTEFLKAEGQCC
jgi:hypothetical protein